jgi:membrane associated rhomboid family serine protease
MTSGADLFVVCKQCGSEVSPYITECPYCGHRLRRRAPKLPRARAPTRTPRAPKPLRRLLARARLGRGRGLREDSFGGGGYRLGARPYATIALVSASCAAWVAWHAEPLIYVEMAIIGPLHGDWWRLFTSPFAYANGLYAFVTLVTIGLFGWLLERRHGPAVVLALFLGAGATGALAATAVYSEPIVSGGNSSALALLAAWSAADLRAARAGAYREGDLLGTAAIAALLLVMPWAQGEASWLAGVTGGALGLALGLGLHRMQATEL